MTSDITSKTIDGITDLVVWAPIKEGFIDAFENITYESRLRIVAEALHNVRQSAREHSLISPFADTAERILSLLDFRIGVVDRDLHEFETSSHNDESVIKPRKYMYLVATFDGPWEPYMRLIWEPLGDFLDLILCNCDGYVPAGDSSFEDYAEWVRTHQLDSAIFYSTSGLTVKDKLYLTRLETLQREIEGEEFDIKATSLISEDPEKVANAVKGKDKYNSNRLALEALNVLYRLADYYPPDRINGQGDGRYLLRASKKLLHGWNTEKIFPKNFLDDADPKERKQAALVRSIYGEPLSWFELKLPESKRPIQTDPHADKEEVQKGLLTSYDEGREEPVTHGALLLLQITDVKKASNFICNFPLSWERESGEKYPAVPKEFENMLSGVFRNLAFTYQGLERLGLTQEELRDFPKEFRQGMEERAPILGDIRNNHPRRWNLPHRWVKHSWIQEDRNTGVGSFSPDLMKIKKGYKAAPPVELMEVDVVIQLRGDASSKEFQDVPKRINKRAELESKTKSASWTFENKLIRPDSQDFLISLYDNHKGDLTFSQPDDGGDFKDFSNSQKINDLREELIASGEDPVTVYNGFKTSYENNRDLKNLVRTFTPLEDFILYLSDQESVTGLSILSIEPMFRDFKDEGSDKSEKVDGFSLPEDIEVNTDHFGFLDGISQPKIVDEHDDENYKLNEVRRGDILIGYKNTRGDYPSKYAANPRDDLKFNGSFLAIRKMSQDAEAFETFSKKYGEEAAAKVVGRKKCGTPLIDKSEGWDPDNDNDWEPKYHNDFDYLKDEEGKKCPFSSHIRRTNPRLKRDGKRPPTPMILRRGMTYGHRYKPEVPEDNINHGPNAERGVMFMAYCANLAEQYETIQRWVNGGNSTNTFSDHKDPLVGPLPKNGKNIFKYIDSDGKVKRVNIEKPFTTLEWGVYLFVPSYTAIQKICEPRTDSSSMCPYHGKKIIEKIESYPVPVQQMEWKILLEDYLTKDPSERATSPDVWAAIRDNGGVHKIKSGVKGRNEGESNQEVLIVADENLINTVLSDHESFSVSEQGRRVEECFAPIYVARDPGDIYDAEATDANRILFEYEEKPAYALAYAIASNLLNERKKIAEATAKVNGTEREIKLELRREFIRPVLAKICKEWYGIPDENDTFIKEGGWGWDGLDGIEPRCPGDFMAPSRHTFYPRPTQAISNYAIKHGKSLKIATAKIVEQGFDDSDNQKATLKGVIALDMMAAIKLGHGSLEEKKDLLVRNIIGTMTGALPPMDGNLRSVFFEWIKENTLWRHQGALQRLTQGAASSYEEANEALRKPIMEAMCKRPAPDLIYRTATKPGTLGSGKAKYEEGDLIILNLVSATQCRLENRNSELNVDMVFGGKRHGAKQAEGHPMHACPAYKMGMGAMLGIVAALMDSGRIQALPASLIIRINEWQPLLPLKD